MTKAAFEKIAAGLRELIDMPYKSRAQEAYFNANRGKLERQGVDVDEWNAASKGKKFPARKGIMSGRVKSPKRKGR